MPVSVDDVVLVHPGHALVVAATGHLATFRDDGGLVRCRAQSRRSRSGTQVSRRSYGSQSTARTPGSARLLSPPVDSAGTTVRASPQVAKQRDVAGGIKCRSASFSDGRSAPIQVP